MTAPPPPKRWFEHVLRGLSRTAMTQVFRTRVFGVEHVPTHGPALIVPNHVTPVDYHFVDAPLRRWIYWLGVAEAFDYPGLEWYLRQARALVVRRNPPSNLPALRAARALLRRGELVGVFFEGRRAKRPVLEVDRPQPGAAWLALKAEVPVVPVTLCGFHRLWPKHHLPRPGYVEMHFHPPLDPRAILPGAPRAERIAALTAALTQVIEGPLWDRPPARPGPRRPKTPA